MQYGISVPNFGDYADPRRLAAFAREAEEAGWDGFFVWDHMTFMRGVTLEIADPWVLLAAIACRTERVKLGALVTPVARRRPWKLAREVTTLDHLSNGRMIFGAGLGAPADSEFADFGEDPDPRVRAAKLDEGLAILRGLWSGEPFAFDGAHYRLHEVTFRPTPLQERLPVWIAGTWPHRPPFRRAARWDGVVPLGANDAWDETMPPEEVRALLAYVREQQTAEERARPFDVAITGSTHGLEDASRVASYRDAGATWWIESISGYRGAFEEMRARVRQGPVRVRE